MQPGRTWQHRPGGLRQLLHMFSLGDGVQEIKAWRQSIILVTVNDCVGLTANENRVNSTTQQGRGDANIGGAGSLVNCVILQGRILIYGGQARTALTLLCTALTR